MWVHVDVLLLGLPYVALNVTGDADANFILSRGIQVYPAFSGVRSFSLNAYDPAHFARPKGAKFFLFPTMWLSASSQLSIKIF